MADIEANNVSIRELFQRFYIVPSYQREYVWGKAQVLQLLEDIRSEQLDEGSSEYFIGSLVVCPSQTRAGAYDLIDGQQRFTTIFIVLCAIRDGLSALGADGLEGIKKNIVDVDTDQDGKDCYRPHLELQYKDAGNIFNDLIDGKKIEKKETVSIKNISIAYNVIKEFFSDTFGDSIDEIRRFFGYLMNNVRLIRISTNSFGRALKIFETINDRGIGLNAMDLLKNHLFMNAEEKDFEYLKECWKFIVDELYKINEKPLRFLRYFIFSTWGVPRLAEDKLYEWIVNNDAKVGLKRDPVGFVERLKSALEAYVNFVNKKDVNGEKNIFLENISLLYRKYNSAKQHLVLLLAGRHLDFDIFSTLCQDIESFLFVCILVKEEIRKFEKIFAEWSLRLLKVKTRKDYETFVRQTFHEQKKRHASKFLVMFREIDGKSLPKYQIEYLLGKLTQAVDKSAYGGNMPLSAYCHSKEIHLEHILPQKSDSDVYKEFGLGADDPSLIWSIGNLALVEKSINMSLGNKAFSYKKRIYPKSRYLLTQIIAEKPDIGNTAIDRAVARMRPFDEWNEDSIRQRARWLADLACTVWNVPSEHYGKGLELGE